MKRITKTILLALTLTLAVQQSFAQQVKGTVRDIKSKEGLIGVNVNIKSSTEGTITDLNGNFEIDLKNFAPVLELSYVGYEAKEVEITNFSGNLLIELSPSGNLIEEVIVTSRRRKEAAQEIPIPITVLGAPQIENSVSFNVNRVKELVPSVQLYSSNPRNTSLNIRGLGTTFGLTNDGIDPGVGYYVDGVYFARPAAATIDFIDIEQVEVLRGPQGTLFGKNTTAGAFNITTRKPTFTKSGAFELSYGNYNFVQGKATISGPLVANKLAARVSFTGTNRNGTIYNKATEKYTNTLNNLGFKVQFLYKPVKKLDILLSADHTSQRPDGYAQVVAGVVKTQRADYRQFSSIIEDLNYQLPSTNPFDRIIDHNTPWKSNQDLGGVSLNIDYKLGKGTLTSTTAWRYWNWEPSNDRDFTGLEALKLSQAPSKQRQWSQEFRYASTFNEKLSGVFGAFLFGQNLKPDGSHTEESGKDQWRFSQSSTSTAWQTPGLLDGYGIKSYPNFKNFSGALYAQLDWEVFGRLRILPGIRLNYDQKSVNFKREVYGGLETSDSLLNAIKKTVYSNQEFEASAQNVNVSGQLSLQLKLHQKARLYATYALSFKPIGLNLGGLPTESGRVMVELAKVKPELVHHFEFGLKSEPFKGATLNLTGYNTAIKNYQTLVQVPDLTLNRGYLANADKIRVWGIELETSYKYKRYITFNGGVSYTNGKYVSFPNAPVPLEEVGGTAPFKDISGGKLPGISDWTTSIGVDAAYPGKLFKQDGEFFIAFDTYYRSSFSSSPSPSKYLNVDGYALLNVRIGYRAVDGFSLFFWTRNLANKNYFEQLLPASGNSGQYAGVLGDPRTFGATIKYAF